MNTLGDLFSKPQEILDIVFKSRCFSMERAAGHFDIGTHVPLFAFVAQGSLDVSLSEIIY